MNSTLLHIKSFVDPAVMELSENAIKTFHHLFVAFRRIRPSWVAYVDDFQVFLTKLEKHDPDCTFFPLFVEALTNHLDKKNPWEKLYSYLEGKGFTIEVLSNMQLSYNEKAFTNRLSKNLFILQPLLFFFYQPRFSIKFFLDSASFLSEEEDILLSDFQKLSPDLKNRVSAYAKDLVKAEHLQSLKKLS